MAIEEQKGWNANQPQGYDKQTVSLFKKKTEKNLVTLGIGHPKEKEGKRRADARLNLGFLLLSEFLSVLQQSAHDIQFKKNRWL